MEELYKVMDDLLEVEFQMKAGMDILKELEEFYMLEKETEKSDARKVAVLMKGYLQSMKSNIREIIRYIDDTTLATVYKGNIIKNLIMDCQSYTKYRPNETTGGIFVSWRRKEELPTGA